MKFILPNLKLLISLGIVPCSAHATFAQYSWKVVASAVPGPFPVLRDTYADEQVALQDSSYLDGGADLFCGS
jgi:hypothetical protein